MKTLLQAVFDFLLQHRRHAFGRMFDRVLQVNTTLPGTNPSKSASGIAVFCGTAIAGIASADLLDSGAQMRPELHLTGMTKYYSRNDQSTSYDTIAATVEMTYYPEARSYWGGLFADYRYSSTNRFDDNLNLGAYFRYNLRRWDTTTWLFVNQAPHNSDTWMYASRLRYRMSENHKLGIEAMAPIRQADALDLMLGYYRSISDSLSLNVLAGTSVEGGPNLAARIELSWQIH